MIPMLGEKKKHIIIKYKNVNMENGKQTNKLLLFHNKQSYHNLETQN